MILERKVEVMKLLLVDDHEMVRSAFSRLLSSQNDMQVVGEASSFEEGQAKWEALKPDVIAYDLDLPGQEGSQGILSLLRVNNPPKVVICSYRANPAEVQLLVQAGIKGYVTKTAPAEELVRAVRAVGQGQTYFCARALEALKEAKVMEAEGDYSHLTPRQVEVLSFVAQGKSTKDVAKLLGLSPKTVENYRSAILRRLDAKNLAHALTRARDLKILDG